MKKVTLVLLSLILITMCSACGIPENEPDLVADISSQNLPYFSNAEFSSSEITQRNTDKTTDELFVTLSDGTNSFDFRLLYNYSKETGWVLNECDFIIPKNNPDLVADVSNAKLPLTREVTITSVETIKRSTQETTDEIYVTVLAEASDSVCTMQYELIYNFYTEGGWILDECIPINSDEWHAEPTKGISEEEINREKELLIAYSPGTDPSYDSVELVSSTEDCENRQHILQFKAEYHGTFCLVERDIYYTFRFDDSSFGSTFSWGWEQDYSSTRIEGDVTYRNLDGDWFYYERGTKYKFTITTSGTTIKFRSPNNYTYTGELTPFGADIDIKSEMIYGPGSHLSFNNNGTITYTSPGFNDRVVTRVLTRN